MRAARLAFERERRDDSATRPPPFADPRRQSKSIAFVGCSGWFYWHWRDQFYPPGLAGSRWFQHYADTFRTVELNAPFYSWPKVQNVLNWRTQVGRRKFLYTIKVNDLITHVKRFSRTAGLVRDFYHVADLLGPHMGCFLFQLPPSFRYSAAVLKRVLNQLDPAYRNVVEFRHRSWWNEKVFAAFRAAGAIFCSVSGPKLPEDLVRTAEDIYVRFHGTTRWYRHDYTKEELAEWAKKIAGSGARRAWIYFNNDRECFAIKNAKELIRQLNRLGVDAGTVRTPRPLARACAVIRTRT